MLQKMRQQSQSAIIIFFFVAIIFVFVFSFGSGAEGFRSGGCGRAGEAVRVNGEVISEMVFQYHYDLALRSRLSSQRGKKTLRTEDKVQLRHQVMENLVNQALLRQAAERIGLHVTDKERDRDIQETPWFQDENKRFDFKKYKMIVQRHFQTSMSLFEEVWREDMLARRMSELIQDTSRVTEEELKQAFISRNTKVNLSFIKVPARLYQKDISPTDEEVTGYLQENKARVEAAYKAQHSRFHKPMKVQVAHVMFELRKEYDSEQVSDKQEQAELTLKDLKKGEDLAKQAEEYSEDYPTKEKGGKLPPMTKEAATARWGAPFAEAAFALEAGGLSEVVRSDKGFHVIKCEHVIPAVDKPLEEVEKSLAKDLFIAERAKNQAKTEAERLFAEVQAGKQLKDLLPEPSPPASPGLMMPGTGPLRVQETGMFVRRGGYIPQMMGSDEDLARTAFSLTMDKPFPERVFELQVSSDYPEYLVFVLGERSDPDMESFTKDEEMLRQVTLGGRRQRQLTAWLQQKREASTVEHNPAFVSDVTPAGFRGKTR